jgi:hypothetical protein
MGIRNSESLVKSEFSVDSDGNPTGGNTEMIAGDPSYAAISIHWQDGIVGDNGQGGAFVEDVLEAARQRLQFFNKSEFRCRENSIAITKIEEALQWLDWRTRQRLIENVENTYEVHTPQVS